jgi:hypothetical protein
VSSLVVVANGHTHIVLLVHVNISVNMNFLEEKKNIPGARDVSHRELPLLLLLLPFVVDSSSIGTVVTRLCW